MNREVTERDFRMPQFRNADPKDYEFRDDGAIVRKDRWETGIHRIQKRVLPESREFEIDDIVAAVDNLVERSKYCKVSSWEKSNKPCPECKEQAVSCRTYDYEEGMLEIDEYRCDDCGHEWRDR